MSFKVVFTQNIGQVYLSTIDNKSFLDQLT